MLPHIENKEQLTQLVCEIGFLPFLPCGVAGFSARELTDDGIWQLRGDACPWEWRYSLAEEPGIAYGKLFRGKIGLISAEWLPAFANYRRGGCDFDTLYELGGISREANSVMQLFERDACLSSLEIQRKLGRVDNALVTLQMRTYLVTSGFRHRTNRYGEEYGWPLSVYTPAELKFGHGHVRSRYNESPEASHARILEQAAHLCPLATEAQLKRMIG